MSLDGKCRACKKKISPQYFFVELVSGLSFLMIFLNYDNYYASFLLAILLLIYLVIFFIDLKHFIIPDVLNYGIIIVAFLKKFLTWSKFELYPGYQAVFDRGNCRFLFDLDHYLSLQDFQKNGRNGLGWCKAYGWYWIIVWLAVYSIRSIFSCRSWTINGYAIFNGKKEKLKVTNPFWSIHYNCRCNLFLVWRYFISDGFGNLIFFPTFQLNFSTTAFGFRFSSD